MTEGHSFDELYLVQQNDINYVLRKLNRSTLSVDREIELMQLCSSNQLPTPTIHQIVQEDGTTWVLQDFLPGVCGEKSIQDYQVVEQYDFGVQAGKTLASIHQLPCNHQSFDRSALMVQKIGSHMDAVKPYLHLDPFLQTCIDTIHASIHLLNKRPTVWQHGDFHLRNMVLNHNHCAIIDFNRCDVGDPYEEFVRAFYFSRDKSIPFLIGQLDGYFNQKIPLDFFPLLRLYLADACLSSITWTLKFYPDHLDEMQRFNAQIQQDFDGFKKDWPDWVNLFNYLKS